MLSAVDETLKKTDEDHCPWLVPSTLGREGKGIYGMSDGGAGLSFNRMVQEGGLTGKMG